ncbi:MULTISPECIES: hypothetical protein [unclassified Plantactinospora]|uniref:hypothetical protein n=1 Tax=unclassified Plantactinospora TaxID=2631981 RepID=UPI000D157F22|nr:MULTISPECIES: hypothetical protein [unclassified Plantactinospora]AVT32713.1 hypothetical protein C6361_28265 [Plantactinospora sp. BC1]AVT39352.1 hypothetical protein C6W10_26205 [Plantactinospora sp. BB1]
MNVNKRERREQPDATRDAQQRAPRSGGRTTVQRAQRAGGGRSNPASEARVRGARRYPTQGSAALREPDWEEPAVRVWDSSEERPEGASESATPARRSRLRVAPPMPVARPRVSFVALILVLVVGGMLGILVVNSKVNENAFRLERLQQQQSTLDIQEQELKQKIADAEVPGNLTARARQLGLVDSGPPAFIRLPDGRVIGVPQPAGGEPAITSQQGAGG